MNTTLKNLLSQKKLPNVITLFGEEQFLVYYAYKQIYDKLLSDDTSKIFIFDPEDNSKNISLFDLLVDFNSPDFFGGNKILVIKKPEKIYSQKVKKEKLEPAEELFKRIVLSPPSNGFLVVLSFDTNLFGITKKIKSDRNALKNLRFPFYELLSNHPWIEFPKMTLGQIKDWISNKFIEDGIKCEDGVVEYLLDILNLDLWEIDSEIQKIKTFLGPNKKLTLFEVAQISSGNKEFNVFEITSLLAKKDFEKTFIFLEKILKISNQGILLNSIILKFFKNLLILTEEIKRSKDKFFLAKSIGVNPYFFDDYFIGLENYSKEEIIEIIKELVNLELQLKSSSKDEVYLFETILLRIFKKQDFPNFA